MPSRRKDCFTPTEPLNPHNLLKSTSTVLPRTMPLPPLSKGGGLTARHKLLLYCVLLVTHPPLLFAKLFCRQDGGIALHPPSLSIPTTFSKAHQPFRPTLNLPPSSKANFCRPKNSCDYRRDCHTIPTINEIFRTTTFITNYTKINYISFYHHLYS